MKKLILILIPVFTFAQVGIKTSTPTHKLEVNGDALIESYIIETENRDVTGSFLLYTRSKDSSPVGEIKKLNPLVMNVAPVNRYNVTISNVDKDRVNSIDTGLKANKYFIAITDARFTGANIGSNTVGTQTEYGTYSNGVGVNSAGNYTVSLDFVGAGTELNTNGNWEFTILVYHISLLTDFNSVTTTISGNSGQPAVGSVVDLFN